MPKEALPAFIRTKETLLVVPSVTGILDGTGALTLIDTRLADGFRQSLEKITYVSTVAHTGAGGTQTFKVRKGGATGTVIATITLTLAALQTSGGKSVQASVAVADEAIARFVDTDTLSFTRDSGGTAFTAGSGQFILTWRQRAQARL